MLPLVHYFRVGHQGFVHAYCTISVSAAVHATGVVSVTAAEVTLIAPLTKRGAEVNGSVPPMSVNVHLGACQNFVGKVRVAVQADVGVPAKVIVKLPAWGKLLAPTAVTVLVPQLERATPPVVRAVPSLDELLPDTYPLATTPAPCACRLLLPPWS